MYKFINFIANKITLFNMNTVYIIWGLVISTLTLLITFVSLVVKQNVKISKVEEQGKNNELKIKEVKQDNVTAIADVRRELQVHEANNDKTYSRIEAEISETRREIKDANGKLDLLIGYYKAKNGQEL